MNPVTPLSRDTHSPREIARALGVSESSLKRWCDQGLIETTRTAGGHRKVLTADAIRFARERKMALANPELLGLPAPSSEKDFSLARQVGLLSEALLAGNEALSRQLVLNLTFSGHSMARLFDDVIAAAFVEIGDRWACERADVYQERRGCEIMLRILAEISKSQSAVAGPLTACGGTVTGNSYALQTLMAEIVLRGCGYQATSLGTGIPFDSLARAVRELRPTVFWLSAAYIADETEFLDGFAKLAAVCNQMKSALVIGGNALTPGLRKRLPEATYCENMQQLAVFGHSLARVYERTVQTGPSELDKVRTTTGTETKLRAPKVKRT